jgi:long-chain fatty acid transport protein
LYLPSNQFVNDGSKFNAPIALTGGNGGNSNEPVALPSFYYAYSYSPTLKFGLGLTIPFGSKIEYDNGWLGRYQVLKDETISTNISPSVAYKLTDKLSLGAGINIQYIKSTLSHAIFTGISDGLVYAKVDDWGLGYTLGALYEFTPNTRIGVNFRSRVVHHLTGPLKFTAVPGRSLADSRTSIDLPESVSLSAFHQWTSHWAVMADVTWTHWSRWQTLRTTISNPQSPDIVDEEHWRDSWRYSLGVTFQPQQRWKFRAGIAYDNNAMTDQYRSADMTQGDKIWLAAGLAYQFTKATTLDFGYTHQFILQSNIKQTTVLLNPLAATLKGHYNTSLDVLGAQLSYTF